MKLRILNNIAICATLSAMFATPSYATAIQSTTPASTYIGGGDWSWHTLGSVDLAQWTNQLTALSGQATTWDQGWGGQDPGQGVFIGLYINNVDVYNVHVAGAVHGATTGFYDINTHPTDLLNINALLGGINWVNPSTSARLTMFAEQQAYGGWTLNVQNASFSATTSAVPEPASIALLASGLIGFTASRRKKPR